MIAYYAHEWAIAITFTVAIWLSIELIYSGYLFYRRGMERVRRLNEREGRL